MELGSSTIRPLPQAPYLGSGKPGIGLCPVDHICAPVQLHTIGLSPLCTLCYQGVESLLTKQGARNRQDRGHSRLQITRSHPNLAIRNEKPTNGSCVQGWEDPSFGPFGVARRSNHRPGADDRGHNFALVDS